MIHLKLNTVGIKQYQSLIIALQWFVALGRFDITSSYRVVPRTTNWSSRTSQTFVWLHYKRIPDGTIHFCTNISDHVGHGTPVQFDWSQTAYGNSVDKLPPDMSVPKVKFMFFTTYQYANLYHGPWLAMSGVLHMISQTLS